jgi:hypothetical protein
MTARRFFRCMVVGAGPKLTALCQSVAVASPATLLLKRYRAGNALILNHPGVGTNVDRLLLGSIRYRFVPGELNG